MTYDNNTDGIVDRPNGKSGGRDGETQRDGVVTAAKTAARNTVLRNFHEPAALIRAVVTLTAHSTWYQLKRNNVTFFLSLSLSAIILRNVGGKLSVCEIGRAHV